MEAVAAKIWMDKFYTVCSLYLSPILNVQRRDVDSLLAQLPKPFLILGDMNARHSRWGEDTNNEKGNLFERLLLEEDISLINEKYKTYYSIQHDICALIDLSLS